LTAAWKVPSPFPKSTLKLLELLLATARSSFPSPLKSPLVTQSGSTPTPYLTTAWKVPSPLPKSTPTSLEPSSATARSGIPSPLKSALITENGLVPVL